MHLQQVKMFNFHKMFKILSSRLFKYLLKYLLNYNYNKTQMFVIWNVLNGLYVINLYRYTYLYTIK